MKSVDLKKFMGQWYVIAFTPTFVDEGAEDGVETYRLREDGNIDIDYTFSINGEFESHKQTGIVQSDQSNAKWRLKYNWLLSFDYYLIVELDPEYHYTVIGVPSRSFVWIMSRKKKMDEVLLKEIFTRLKEKGYDLEKIERMKFRSV
ncbi:MAG: lipocalin family protein [SAR324 cluster bacterium]|nr:lipocalin family protein [SAR324 cluster bacterium]